MIPVYDPGPPEPISMEAPPPPKPVHYKVEHKQVSENIRKFDKKVQQSVVQKLNPFDYNTISLQKKVDVPPSQQASDLIAQPTYNTIGKFLGVDTIHDWNKVYDKVYTIAEWAKAKAKTDDIPTLMRWIANQTRTVPSLGQGRRLDELYLFAKLHFQK